MSYGSRRKHKATVSASLPGMLWYWAFRNTIFIIAIACTFPLHSMLRLSGGSGAYDCRNHTFFPEAATIFVRMVIFWDADTGCWKRRRDRLRFGNTSAQIVAFPGCTARNRSTGCMTHCSCAHNCRCRRTRCGTRFRFLFVIPTNHDNRPSNASVGAGNSCGCTRAQHK